MTTLGATASTVDYVGPGYGGEYKAGWYVSAPCNAQAAIVPVVNIMYASRIIIPKACSVERIGCAVTAVAASSVVRLGIYNTGVDGLPGTLLLDAGTVDSASGTGDKEITISQALTPGFWWLIAVPQGGTPTMSTWTAGATITAGFVDSSATYNLTNYYGFKSTATVSGALPGTYPFDWSGQPIRVWLRYT